MIRNLGDEFERQAALVVGSESAEVAPVIVLDVPDEITETATKGLQAVVCVVAAGETVRRVLSSYVDYYQRTRTHLSLDEDCPDPRPIMPCGIGKVVAIPQVGGLHHRYERLAA